MGQLALAGPQGRGYRGLQPQAASAVPTRPHRSQRMLDPRVPAAHALDRRAFLRTLAAGAAVGALPTHAWAARRNPCPPGVQLYTVRDHLARDLEGTLARVAEIGFREVEFAEGYAGHAPAAIRRALDAAGLTSPATHVGMSALGPELERTLGAAGELGHQYVLIPWIPPEERTMHGYRRLAAALNRAGEAGQ